VKKTFSWLLLLVMALTLASAADALVKKKKQPVKKKYYRRIIRNWPKGGPQPVFPKAGDEKAVPVAPTVEATKPARPAAAPARSRFFAESGLADGGLAAEFGYQRSLNDKLSLSGAAGYLTTSSYSSVVFDLLRGTYDIKDGIFAGAGLNWARGMSGLELFAGRQFGGGSLRAGYSGILGLRAGVNFQF
jgi:hypothetical protein